MRRTLALAAVILVLPGCVHPGTTTLAPTFQCTGADPDPPRTPCSQEEYDAQQQTYALEREAMSVYEKYWALRMAFYEKGPPEDAAVRLSPYLAEPILSDAQLVVRRERARGLQPSKVTHSLRMWPSRTETIEGTLVAIVGCEDPRGSTFIWSNHEPSNGSLFQVTRHFTRVDGRLKNFDITSEKQVEQCDR